LSCGSPSPNLKRRVSSRKQGRQATLGSPRIRRVPYERRPLDLSPSAGSSVPNEPDDVLTPDFMRSLKCSMQTTLTVGPSSLPESHGPVFQPQRPSNPRTKSPSSSPPTQNDNAITSQRPEELADLYCRYPDCHTKSPDKRTIARHRLTHLAFNTYACPNPECPSHTKARPGFSREFAVNRHLRLADSPCAKWKDGKILRRDVDLAEVLLQQALVPFDPAIHLPFKK
jgi:hypothetical protein